MEHATALVDHDATPHQCSCRKLTLAGWKVRCHACGWGFEEGEAPSRFADLDLDFAGVEDEDRIRHRGDRMAEADDGYDVLRDAELVDEAERRVA